MIRTSIQKKIEVEKKLTPLFHQAKSMVIAHNRGLTVEQVTRFRRSCREAGVTFKVIKNTMSRRIVKQLKWEGLADYLKGPTALAFHPQDEAAPIKVITEFLKKNKEAKIEVKAGWVNGQVLDRERLAQLAKIPSKAVLLAQLASTLQAPMAQVAAVLAALLRPVPAVLLAVVEKKKTEKK